MPFPKPASCQACPGWAWGADGFMPEPAGEGRLGVMLVGEALGSDEAQRGVPFVGAAGFLLGQAFQRGGWQREDFWISNALCCRPPGNKLKGTDYEGAVLAACAPHLDRHIRERKPKAIVALGATAMQRLLGLPWTAPLTGRKGWRGYATYSERYEAWVLPTYHPSFIQRGQPELLLPLIADIQHACEWAAGKLTPIEPTLLIDPPIGDFEGWAQAYLRAAATDPSLRLTVDIETPTKGTLEDEGWADPTYTILRVGLHWRGQEGVSIPFAMPYVAVLADLLAADHTLYLWNALYDLPRLRAAGLAVNGSIIDGMWMWHLLESDQPKALDHAAPLLCPEIPRWKHLAGDEPGRYSALDGVYEGLVCAKAEVLLYQRGLWETFERHILRLDAGPCAWMHDQGLLVDGVRRGVEAQASAERREALVGRMQAVVPEALKPTKVYKMRPPLPEPGEVWTTVVEEAEVKVCSACGLVGVTGEHTKRKRDNPCYKAEVRKERRGVERRALVSPFSPSAQQLKGYAEAKGHKLVTTRKKVNGFTFDDAALVTLGNRYPSDPLYGLVQDYREEEKLGSTYLGRPLEGGGWEGGLVTSPDGRIHTTFTHNPSTLRFSSVNPNLQNLPRGDDEDSPYGVVRELFTADPGCLLVEADFRAIEAVLVGYFARSPEYIRLARLGVHDFVLAHAMGRSDLVDVNWSDTDLKLALKQVKKLGNGLRPAVKTIVHGGNYVRGAFDISRLQRKLFPKPSDAQRLLDLYFGVCPAIQPWQRATVEEAHRQGYLQNPFGYPHRFWMAKAFERQGREWVATFGPDAKRAVAFRPQSTAAGIIREVMARLWEPEWLEGLGRYLRLQVHDSLLWCVPKGEVDRVLPLIPALMAAPVKALPLPAAWGMGPYLSVEVEVKVGECWGAMEEVGG